MKIKLTKGQMESFSLLHANIVNALMYAEDLLSYREIHFRESMPPIVTKLRWLKSALELKIPEDKRAIAQGFDMLKFDEMLRLMSHMNEEQFSKLEKYANEITAHQ
jgi:hypothetical protein